MNRLFFTISDYQLYLLYGGLDLAGLGLLA
jgi:hypothetical protein